MFVCFGNIQWYWPRCPSQWHSRHLYPFVMLNFQCFVASSLGQSMPHSCSFKDPMCFPFSNSGYMPAKKIKSLHSTAGSENIWQLCCRNVPYGDHNFKDKCGIKLKKKQNQWTLWDHAIPSACYSFHLIPLTQFSRGPSHHKSGSLNNKYEYHSASQSTARKSPANVRTPSVTSSEPCPKQLENPSGATAASVGRIHRGPRRDQLIDHGAMAFQSRKMQRRVASGAEDATPKAGLRLPSRNKAYSHGMFLRVVGQIFLDRS